MCRFYTKRRSSRTVLFLAAAVFILLRMRLPSVRADAQEEHVPLLFFHTVMCESCDPDSELCAILEEELDQQEGTRPYELHSFCVYSTEGRQELDKLASAGLYDGALQWPALLVGDVWLEGYDAIRQQIAELLAADGTPVSAPAETESAPAADGSAQGELPAAFSRFTDGTVNLLYFKTESCESCRKAEEALEALPAAVTVSGTACPVVLVECSIMEPDNANLLYALFEQYGVEPQDQVVPILFAGDRFLAGADAIGAGAQEAVLSGGALGAKYTAESGEIPFVQSLEWGGVLVTGLLNGLNPCMLSMTLLFLSLLLALPKAVKRCAIAFLAGKYVSYLLLGILIYYAASGILYESISSARQIGAAVLFVFAAVLAVLNFLDFLSARKGEYGRIRLQLPESLRKWNHALMHRLLGEGKHTVLIPAVFAVSFLISAGELLCAGQIYLASILSWLQMSAQSGVPILLFILYVTALCIPSAVLILLCVRGKSLFRLSQASLRQMTWTKLANALLFLVMACLAAWMLL